MSGAEPCTGSNSETRPGWMLPEAARPATADRGAQVGEDVAEQVAGHHDIEALGGADEFHRRYVDVKVAGGDAARRVLGGDFA